MPVYGLVHDANGEPCYAMRFIHGETLDDAIKNFHEADKKPGRDLGQRSVALRQLLTRFIAVCNTIAYAHSRGVLHRDLKPNNVMLGKYGETLVVDWGLAKPFERTETERATGEETLAPTSDDGLQAGTRLGKAKGTPAYMSPEQAKGEWNVVGPASDIFSLGATFYALLTGQAPYRGRNQDEVLGKAGRGDFAPPRQLKNDVPRALEAICLKAMAREPERRYGTAKELAADVEQWLADEPVTAYRETLTARAGRWARRHKPVVAAVTATILVIGLLSGVGAWWLVRYYSQQRQGVESALAEVYRLQQQARYAEAGGFLDRAQDRLGEGGPQDLREQLEQARRDLDLVARLDAIRLKRATLVEGHLVLTTADGEYAAAFQEAGLGQVGDDPAAMAARIARSTVSGALVAALDDWAACAAETRRAWVLEVARKSDPDPERDRLRDPALWNDGTALSRWANKARVGELSPQLLAVLGNRLTALKGDAESLLRAAQERYAGDFGVNFELGNALEKGKPGEAVGYYRAALALRPRTPVAHNNLGHALHDKGRVDEAVAEWQKAIALDPKYALPHGNLGLALLQQGRFSESRKAIQHCLELHPANHPQRQFFSQQLRQCEQMIVLDKKLSAVLKGEAKPANAAEQISLARLCQIKKRYVAAARFCTDAFAAQPKLTDDLQAGHRYDAACFAALAVAGQGEDAGKLDNKERARLRQQALEWLRADLALWAKQVESGKPEALAMVRQTLQHWQKDTDLAGVRDRSALAKLPEAERQQWHKLWDDVEALLKRTAASK